MGKKLFCGLLSLLVMCSMIFTGSSKVNANDGSKDKPVDLWEAVKPLSTTASFLNTGAHPDDEQSHLDAYLSRGLGVTTGLSLATRGRAGQNEIGDELGNGLAIIRTHELEKSSELLGVNLFILNHAFNDSIYDFGFSKSPKETLSKWDENEAYKRLVKVIRTFKPDIVMPSFRDVDTQHGHHRAVTELTLRAFEGAADPNVFPEQLKDGLTTWQIKKLYLPAASKDTATTQLQIGIYDPILGMTYPQLGEQARYFHKSQGMGREVGNGPESVSFELVKSAVGSIPNHESSIFDGIPYNFNDYAKQLDKGENAFKGQLTRLQQELDSIVAAYPSYRNVLDLSHQALKDVRKIKSQLTHFKPIDENLKNTLMHKLDVKEQQLEKASLVASQLHVDLKVNDTQLTEGDSTTVTLTFTNNGSNTLNDVSTFIQVPEGWTVDGNAEPMTLMPGESTTLSYHVVVPNKTSQYDFFGEPDIQAKVSYEYDHITSSQTFIPNERIAVLPKVALKVDPEQLVINTAEVKDQVPVSVHVHKYAEGESLARISLQLPSSEWSIDGQDQLVSFAKDETDKVVQFNVHPPKDLQEGKIDMQAFATIEGEKLNTTVQTISYPHIGTDYYLYNSAIDGVAFPLHYSKDLKIGYIDSGFDKVADRIADIGMNITKLTPADLQSGDLSQYDTIVTGIRAYLSRDDLLQNNQRLLDYVNNGGHLVVQYNKPGDNWDPTLAPYNLVIGSPSIKWRVTDENAQVNVLQPDSPLFNAPNKITDQDWANWVQERGLYYPMQWDSHYKTLVSMADPGEQPFDGGILMTDYGKGTYIYTNLVWYREIQNQVPGGYRIFTNLISYPSVN